MRILVIIIVLFIISSIGFFVFQTANSIVNSGKEQAAEFQKQKELCSSKLPTANIKNVEDSNFELSEGDNLKFTVKMTKGELKTYPWGNICMKYQELLFSVYKDDQLLGTNNFLVASGKEGDVIDFNVPFNILKESFKIKKINDTVLITVEKYPKTVGSYEYNIDFNNPYLVFMSLDSGTTWTSLIFDTESLEKKDLLLSHWMETAEITNVHALDNTLLVTIKYMIGAAKSDESKLNFVKTQKGYELQ